VDRDTFELYGHLVASDIFNGGYVIPMTQTFDSIKHQFNASAVELPGIIDIFLAQVAEKEHQVTNSQPCQNSPGPKSGLLNGLSPLTSPCGDLKGTTDNTVPPSANQDMFVKLDLLFDAPMPTQLDFPIQKRQYPVPQQSEISRLISESLKDPLPPWGSSNISTSSSSSPPRLSLDEGTAL
jgi:hypothetical protein